MGFKTRYERVVAREESLMYNRAQSRLFFVIEYELLWRRVLRLHDLENVDAYWVDG